MEDHLVIVRFLVHSLLPSNVSQIVWSPTIISIAYC